MLLLNIEDSTDLNTTILLALIFMKYEMENDYI